MSECTSSDLSLMNGGSTLIMDCLNGAAGSGFPTVNMTSTCLESSGISTTCSTCMSGVVDDFGSCVSTTCNAWSAGIDTPTTLSSECQACISNLNTQYGSAATICGIDPNGLPGNLWSTVKTEVSTALGTNSAQTTSLRSVVSVVLVGTLLLINL